MATTSNYMPENDFSYDVVLHSVVSYNQNLRKNRFKRLPYIDNATGIAQRPFVLLNQPKYRLPPKNSSQYARYMPVNVKKSKGNTISSSQVVKQDLFTNKTDGTGNSSLPDDSWRGLGDDENAQNSWATFADNDFDSEGSDMDKDDSYSIGRKRKRGPMGSSSMGRRSRGRFGTNPRKKNPATPSNNSMNNSMGFSNPYLDDMDSSTPQETILKPGIGQITVFTCNICKSRYKSKAGLNYHMNSQHPHLLMNSPGRGRASIIQNFFTQEIINDADFVPNNNQTHGRKSTVMEGKGPVQPGMLSNPEEAKIIHQLQQQMPQQMSSQPRPADPIQKQNQAQAMQQYNQIMNRANNPNSVGDSYLASALANPSFDEVPPTPGKREQEPSPINLTDEPAKKKQKPSIKEQMIDSSHPDASTKTCDFCSGTVAENKKTNQSENMITCCDCTRCAHLSCLKFNKNMTVSVGTYHWQCLECKTCWLCETSENDEEMLFCDDCDRGYHMYCLQPPIETPPDGSWSCKLCLERFKGEAASQRPKAKPEGSNETIKID